MYVDAAQFISDHPEFDTASATDPNAVEFSASAITFWINCAVNMLNPCRWDDSSQNHPTVLELGVEMFAAHHLALEAFNQQQGKINIPGMAKGVIAGTNSGDTSVAYDTNSVLELDAGHWNYTTYGKRFIHMAKLMGAAGVYVGAGCDPTGLNGPAWQGIWNFNGPNFDL